MALAEVCQLSLNGAALQKWTKMAAQSAVGQTNTHPGGDEARVNEGYASDSPRTSSSPADASQLLPQHLLCGFSQDERGIISNIVTQVLNGELPKESIAEVCSVWSSWWRLDASNLGTCSE